jgi:CDP-glucose 4,6-dehydratase
VETYSTNVMGTVHVLEAVRNCPNLKSIVSVTTDKVYENQEWVWGYRENEPLGGYDPYSSSKGCAELVTAAYRRSFFSNENNPAIATARAGNVIGGGDWSADRLIPDAIKAFEKGDPVVIRNPLATRPWQHVLEPLSGYLILAEQLYLKGKKYSEAWNFGPEDKDCRSVQWILDELVAQWGGEASWMLDKNPQPHEARFLKLDCSKAKAGLHWYPKWEIGEVLQKIVNWQVHFRQGSDMQAYCLNEIKTYSN